jgi:short-subunit dehydrogenase
VLSAEPVAGSVWAVIDSKHGLDVLLNNAGAGYATPILDIDIVKAKKLCETNIWGSTRISLAFLLLVVAAL